MSWFTWERRASTEAAISLLIISKRAAAARIRAAGLRRPSWGGYGKEKRKERVTNANGGRKRAKKQEDVGPRMAEMVKTWRPNANTAERDRFSWNRASLRLMKILSSIILRGLNDWIIFERAAGSSILPAGTEVKVICRVSVFLSGLRRYRTPLEAAWRYDIAQKIRRWFRYSGNCSWMAAGLGLYDADVLFSGATH